MITLPNECLFEIFNNFRTYHESLYSCLLVNRRWCRIIVPILWSEPSVYFKSRIFIEICLLALNAEEQALLIPFNIILPDGPKPLFEYTSYITAICSYLNRGIEKWFRFNHAEYINNTAISAVRCSLIAMFLRTCKNLKHLQIIGTIYDEIIFIERLCKNTTITFLSIFDNYFEKRKALAEAFYQNIPIVSLGFYNNQLGPEGMKALAKALCTNTTLTSLCISNNRLGTEGSEGLAKALYKNNTLTSLELSNNQIGYKGAKALAEALYINTTLTSLDLYNNKLGSEGGEALAKVLFKNTTITTLNLSRNGLGSKGGKILAKALCQNTTITSLNLSYNELGLEGGKALAEVIYKNTTVTLLNLSCNGLCYEGMRALAEAFCKNTTLITFDLSCNRVRLSEKLILKRLLHKNRSLRPLIKINI